MNVSWKAGRKFRLNDLVLCSPDATGDEALACIKKFKEELSALV